MNAWSLAWNVAVVPIADETVRILQVRRTGKGCLSYIIGSEGKAAVIDPSVSIAVYITMAREHGWSIHHVVDTHVHADHLSRARELSGRVGAGLRLPPQDRVRSAFTPVVDGEQIPVGSAPLTAVSTPGHTTESMSFVLNAAAVFTGDTLFTDGVGRPDLHANVDVARRRAAALFTSLSRLRQLPSDTLVLPAHASEPIPFDGRPIAARLRDLDVWLASWLTSEAAFVDRVTSQLPPTPPNFLRIIELNEAGETPSGDPTELEAGANRCAVK